MAPLSSPYKIGSSSTSGAGPLGYPSRHRSASPLPPLPPKAIDLNSSTRSTDQASGSKITRRAFICDVVAEYEGEETTNLLSHLGRPLTPPSTLPSASASSSHRPTTPSRYVMSDDEDDAESSRSWSPRKKEEMGKRLYSLVEELVRTERSYLQRLKALKSAYADPLRSFAKDKHTQIIPLYEAKNLFANIDQVVPASTAFLADLEAMWESGCGTERVGDVCLKHLRDLTTFAPYRTYLGKQDEVQKLFQEALKKYSGFSSFIDSTKYQTTGIGNIGLRELLMEPVQRIPRYTLLWQTMIKSMSPMSTQRVKLTEAIDIASRIAKCEPDAQTVRATVMYCLQRNVEDFPADLFSSKRDFIDSLDVDGIPSMDYMSPSSLASRPLSSFSTTSASTPSLASIGSSASSSQLPVSPTGHPHPSLSTLHCTLFLFDDKLIIVKRQSAAVSGRKVTGLDDVARLVKSGGGVAVMDKNGAKKDKLSYRGIVDILDVIASDVGNGDFHLFFERPPTDQTDRWSARAFRSYTSVSPPYSATLDSVAVRKDKARFIQNLWAAQTVARAKMLPKELDPPRAMVGEYEVGLEAGGEVFGRAKCYWSVWDKRAWSSAGKKAKVVLQVDESGTMPDLQLSEETGPVMLFRLQPLDGGLCRLSYTTLADDDDEREVMSMSDVPDKVATIIHRYGIFKFRTSNASNPATPSNTSHRLRPSMLNLDAISRNLFGSGAPSIRSQTSSQDTFGTTTSKLSKGLSRSGTEASRMSSSSTSEDRKRLSRLSSSSASASEREAHEQEDDEEEEVDRALPLTHKHSSGSYPNPSPYKASSGQGMGQSDIDLNERLQLARKNSKSMAALSPRPSRRLDTRSHGELRRGKSEEPGMLTQLSTADMILASLPLGSSIATPTTAPLRVRNRSPSPTRPSTASSAAFTSPAPQLPHIPTASPFTVPRAVPALDVSSLGFVSSPPQMDLGTIAGPSTPTPTSAVMPLSPRLLGPRSPGVPGPKSPLLSASSSLGPQSPILSTTTTVSSTTMSVTTLVPQGPRSPAPRPLPSAPALAPGIGSAHTRLRVVSGTGRRVSAGRETVPLKGSSPGPASASPSPDDNSPSRSTTPTMLSKRQRSEDHLTPRKRSLTRSPLEPRSTNPLDMDLPDPPRIPSSLGNKRSPIPSNLGIGLGAHPGARRASGTRTPRKGSAAHLTPRKASVASVISAVSATSNGTAETSHSEDVEMGMADHPDGLAALTAGIQRVTESKVSVKRLRLEVLALKKSMAKDMIREPIRSIGLAGGAQGSLPRSPQRRNMNRLLDIESMGDYGNGGGVHSRNAHAHAHATAKLELESSVAEERLRGMVALAERLEGNLRAALADLEAGRGHVGALVSVSEQRSAEVDGLKAQVQRAKEQQELLRQQLGDTQLEVDTIYELDGMFNDAQLPPTEAFQTLQRDLQGTKSERNELRLENMRLRRELEEANLKREQWARMMRDHGVIPVPQ